MSAIIKPDKTRGIQITLSDGTIVYTLDLGPEATAHISSIEVLLVDGSTRNLILFPQPVCSGCEQAIPWEHKGYIPHYCPTCRIGAAKRNIQTAIAVRKRGPKPDAPEITCSCSQVFKRSADDGGSKRCKDCRTAAKHAQEARRVPSDGRCCDCSLPFEQPARKRGGRKVERCPVCRKARKRELNRAYARSVRGKARAAEYKRDKAAPPHRTPPARPQHPPVAPAVPKPDPESADWLATMAARAKPARTTAPSSIPLIESDTFSGHCDTCKKTVATFSDDTETVRCGECHGKAVTPIVGVAEAIIDGQLHTVIKYASPGWASTAATDAKDLLPDWWDEI